MSELRDIERRWFGAWPVVLALVDSLGCERKCGKVIKYVTGESLCGGNGEWLGMAVAGTVVTLELALLDPGSPISVLRHGFLLRDRVLISVCLSLNQEPGHAQCRLGDRVY
jgi:hypothetical protein